MAGNKPSKWQDKHLRKMENLIHDLEFQKDAKHLETDSSFGALYRLAQKYDVQATLIREYIETGSISLNAVVPSMSIICDDDETAGPASSIEHADYNYIVMTKFPHAGVRIHVPPGSSQVEIMSFIKDNWSYIETKIGKPLRNKRKSTAERNAQIVKLFEQGLSNQEILEKIRDQYPSNLTTDDIGAIIRKNK